MRCPHCQTEQGDQNFCSDCGKPLKPGIVKQQAHEAAEQSLNDEAELLSPSVTNEQSADEHHADFFHQEVESEPATALDEPAVVLASQAPASSPVKGTGLQRLLLRRETILPFISAAVMLAASMGLGVLLRDSNLLEDWLFKFYRNGWNWDRAMASAAADVHTWSWWRAAVQMHAAAIHTEWLQQGDGAGVPIGSYSLYLPLLGFVIVTVILLAFVHKLAKWRSRQAVDKPLLRLAGWVVQAVIYGLLAASALGVFHPSQSWDTPSPLSGYEKIEHISFLAVWMHAGIIYLAASALAAVRVRSLWRILMQGRNGLERQYGPGDTNKLVAAASEVDFHTDRSIEEAGAEGGVHRDQAVKRNETSRSVQTSTAAASLRMLVQWGMMICGALLLIGALTPLVWALSNPAAFYQQPMEGWVHQWEQYRSDPLLYAVTPAFLLQEWLFATGGAIHLNGPLMSSILQLQPMHLQLITGLTVDGDTQQALSAGLQQIAQAARHAWHVYALLLITVYGTARVTSRYGWKHIGILVIGSGIFGASVAAISALSIQVPEEGIGGRLGFGIAASGIQVVVITLISAAIGKIKWERRGKAGEVRTDED